MSTLGATLAQAQLSQQQQQPASSTQPSAQPTTSPTPPAREMAEAAITALESRERDQQGARPSGDSRLRTTIDRLSTMAGGTARDSD
eukprot:5930297-Pyramimonas_sp.AAC.1